MIEFKRPAREIRRVFLHCSASDDPKLYGYALEKEIDRWHKARGFVGIGYHYVIDKIGMVIEGRSLEQNPAAQQGHNKHTIAMCVHGLALEKFTDAALSAVLNLCDHINHAYDGKVTFHGHREVAAKACPVFDYKSLLQLNAAGHMPLNFPRKER